MSSFTKILSWRMRASPWIPTILKALYLKQDLKISQLNTRTLSLVVQFGCETNQPDPATETGRAAINFWVGLYEAMTLPIPSIFERHRGILEELRNPKDSLRGWLYNDRPSKLADCRIIVYGQRPTTKLQRLSENFEKTNSFSTTVD